MQSRQACWDKNIYSKTKNVRQPSPLSFCSFGGGFNSPITPLQLRSVSSSTIGGYCESQDLGISPKPFRNVPRAIRGSPTYSSCSSPRLEQPSLFSLNSPSTSPLDSDISNISSTDLSETLHSLNISQPGETSLPLINKKVFNLKPLHLLSNNPFLRDASISPPPQPWLCPSPQYNLDGNVYDTVTRYDRTQPAFETTCTWSGVLPPRFLSENPTFSCKLFLGGVPCDVTEDILIRVFSQFGKIRVDWPGKERGVHQPKGFAYIIFESEKRVRTLLNCCTRAVSSGNCTNWYFRISSRKMKSKEVQVIPWSLDDSNFVEAPSQKIDPHTTVFVGALHGMINAEGLFKIMNDLFGGVVYAGIDTDKFKYPIGSARVTFNNRQSYMRAVAAEFIEIRTPKFTKKVQVNPYLDDSPCSCCVVRQGPYFCREFSCFRYFCQSCWILQHQCSSEFHKPLMRRSKSVSQVQMHFDLM